MPSYNEVLQSVLGMQQNAQAALPVIPNNGNPNGANNMPAAAGAPAVAGGGGGADKYPWLQPSDSMNTLQRLLSRPIMQGYQGPMPGTQEFRDARAAGEHPIMDYMRQQRQTAQPPVMPVHGNGNTGIVPPALQQDPPHTMGPNVNTPNLPVLPYSR